MSSIARGVAPKRAAEYLGISEQTLRKQRCARSPSSRLPSVPFLRAGRRIIYLLEDLDAWLDARRVATQQPSVSKRNSTTKGD